MTIKIIQDKTSKKKKTVKKIAKKKKNGNIKRNIDLSITYRSNAINIISRNNKKKSNKKIFRKIVVLLFIICLAFSTVFAYNHLKSYLCSLERFFIDSIEVTGCRNITKSEIINILPFKVGESSIAIGLRQAEKKLKRYKTELKDISMSRTNWGKKVIVSLVERSPEVFIYIDDKILGLDFDNKPFNLRGNMLDMRIPILNFKSDEERKNLLNFYSQIKVYILNLIPDIREIKYGDIDDIILIMNNEACVYWGLPKENKNKEKAEKLKQVLYDLSLKNKKVKSIDLSFLDYEKNKIVVDLFDEKNVS